MSSAPFAAPSRALRVVPVRLRAPAPAGELTLVSVALCVALLVRWGVAAFLAPAEPQYDAAAYHEIAVHVVRGEGFHWEGTYAFYPPLHSLFLAAVYAVLGPSVPAAQAAQIGLSLILLVLIYLLTKTLFGGRAALIALAIGAIHPQLSRYPALLMSENLYLPLLIGACWTFARFPSVTGRLVTGLLLGLLALTREIGLGLGVGLAAFCVISGLRQTGRERRLRLLGAACLLLGTLAVVSPWTLRNYRLLHTFVPVTTNFGGNFYLGYNPKATGYYHVMEPPASATGADEVAVNEAYVRETIDWIRANPLRSVELTAYRVWLMWRPFFLPQPEDGRIGVAFAAAKTLACVVIFAGVLAAWRLWRDTRLLPMVLVCVIATGAHAITHLESGARYRLPVETALLPLAGAGLARLVRADGGSEPHPRASAVAQRPA